MLGPIDVEELVDEHHCPQTLVSWPAQQRLDPRQHLPPSNWPGHTVISARAQRLHALAPTVIAAGDDHHGHVAQLANLRQHPQPTAVPEFEIECDDVRLLGGERIQTGLSIGRHDDLYPDVGKHIFQRLPLIRIATDCQHLAGIVMRRCSRSNHGGAANFTLLNTLCQVPTENCVV